MSDASNSKTEQYLRLRSGTTNKGGLPTIERYNTQVHNDRLQVGGHSLEIVDPFLQVRTRVTAQAAVTGEQIAREVWGPLDEVDGTYPVWSDTSASAIYADGWTVRPGPISQATRSGG